MNKVKVIASNDNIIFEQRVNLFFEKHHIVSVQYSSSSYKYEGDTDIFVEYIAFITYMEVQGD